MGGARHAGGADARPHGVIVYGVRPVIEALRGRRGVLRLWAADDSLAATARGEGAPAPVRVVSADELERLCGSGEHQGLVCEAEPYPYADAAAFLTPEDALVVVLDQVQDPQNLGAICRSAECAGATGVVVPERRAAEITPAVCRASAGAVEHLAVARVRNLADYLAAAKEAGAWVYGAEAGAARAYTDVDWRGRAVIVLGSEGTGMRPRVRAACDELVSLPLRGHVDSLNVAATGAVLLYEAARFRAGPEPAALDKST
jgi:23S rRNA (guanosine2251-2'-O)-methyltransferase